MHVLITKVVIKAFMNNNILQRNYRVSGTTVCPPKKTTNDKINAYPYFIFNPIITGLFKQYRDYLTNLSFSSMLIWHELNVKSLKAQLS